MIRKCDFDPAYAHEKLPLMKSLTTLDVNGCYWVEDNFTKTIAKLNKKLQLLNIGGTSITHNAASSISQLYRLKNLDVGGTSLNHKSIE